MLAMTRVHDSGGLNHFFCRYFSILYPTPPHCGDDLVLTLVFLHLTAKATNMYHNGVVGLIDLLIPDLLKDFIRAEHLARVGGQKIKDVKLDRGSASDFFIVHRHLVIVFIDRKASDADLVLYGLMHIAVRV